ADALPHEPDLVARRARAEINLARCNRLRHAQIQPNRNTQRAGQPGARQCPPLSARPPSSATPRTGIPAAGASNAGARRALNSRNGAEDRGRTTRPDPRRAFRSTLLHLGLNGLDNLRHGDLRIGLLTLEIGLPNRLADHELLQSEEVVVDGPGPVQLPADQPD